MKDMVEMFAFFLVLLILVLNIKSAGWNRKKVREYNVFTDIGNKIKNGVNKAINSLKNEMNKIKNQILGVFQKIEDAFNEISSVMSSIPGRMANIEKGFKISMEAIGDEIENLGKGIGAGFQKTFDLIGETGNLTINAMECGIDKINYLPECFPVYLFDTFFYFTKLMFRSILNAAELYIGFKKNFGVDMNFYLDYMYDILVYMDKTAYNMTGFHFMQYPDFILNKCYRCRQPLNTEKVVAKSKEVSRAFNDDLPRLLNEPAQKFKTAQRSFEAAFQP